MPILDYFYIDRPTIIKTDVLDIVIVGAVSPNRKDNNIHPWNHRLRKQFLAECTYNGQD
jgi:hypothetical protein